MPRLATATTPMRVNAWETTKTGTEGTNAVTRLPVTSSRNAASSGRRRPVRSATTENARPSSDTARTTAKTTLIDPSDSPSVARANGRVWESWAPP